MRGRRRRDVIRYSVKVEEYGCDDPGEVFGLRLRLEWYGPNWDDAVTFGLDEEGARELVAWISYLEWSDRAEKRLRGGEKP